MVRGAGRRLVWCVENPGLARGDAETRLASYRQVRDTLLALIEAELLPAGQRGA